MHLMFLNSSVIVVAVGYYSGKRLSGCTDIFVRRLLKAEFQWITFESKRSGRRCSSIHTTSEKRAIFEKSRLLWPYYYHK